MTVAFAPELDRKRKSQANHILNSIGKTLWIDDEQHLHSITGVSGSGPGYVLKFMEGFYNEARAQGLPEHMIRTLVVQTFLGTAQLAKESDASFATLREQVTSKGGTTEAGLKILEDALFDNIVSKAIKAAEHRSRELARVTDKS
jgi:pyrroline-5-carboxylate reductase